MSRLLRHYSLYCAWIIALIATVVSLYFSVVQQMPVCNLCWYQRICIYPLTIILAIAAYRNDRGIIKYAMPLTVLGLLFSMYQYLEQMVADFAPINLCGMNSGDCSQIHFKLLGFITFPFLSILATLAIAFFLITAAAFRKQ